MPASLRLTALPNLPMIQPGDDLAELLLPALRAIEPGAQDVLVLAQKIVSKAEGRRVALSSVTPSPRAIELGRETGKDPRIVEAILSESARVVRARPGLMIMQHRLGMVMANAGIDQSNVATPGEDPQLLLLPADPDASAARLHQTLSTALGRSIAVIINDSFGRAWRRGTAGVAIGAAGLPAMLDLRGQPDLFGRTLEVSIIGLADEIASAASLLMGQAAEGQPAVLVQGLTWTAAPGAAADLIRPEREDLFR